VAPPIRIEWLESREAIDLAEALAVRGIVGRPVRSTEGHAVVVHDPRERVDRLVDEIVAALESWLADRGRGPVSVRVGTRVHDVAAREALPGALMERARARRAVEERG
jgi:hypothetical protein